MNKVIIICLAALLMIGGQSGVIIGLGLQFGIMKIEIRAIARDLQSLRATLANGAAQKIVSLKILTLQSEVESEPRQQIANTVCKYAKLFGEDSDLILAIIYQESNFDPNALSNSKPPSKGLMQVFPSWEKNLCKGMNLMNINDNIHCGTKVLSYYRDAYSDLGVALTVYNRGPNPVEHAMANDEDPINQYAIDVLQTYNRLKSMEAIVLEGEENS